MSKNEIRLVIASDVDALKEVLDSSDLFSSEMLEEIIADYLENPYTEDIWFTYTENEKPISIGYCAPEKFTDGTYNLYALGVTKNLQGKGIGMQMMEFIEELLKERGARVLIVETSSTVDFELTREFYLKCNYHHEATIRDFWNEGDHKVVFWKKLIE